MLEDRSYMREPEFRTRPAISMTILLLLINIAVFILQEIYKAYVGVPEYYRYLALSTAGIKQGYLWQLFTFQFLHGSVLHIGFNMLALYFFGRPLESTLGGKRFLQLYLGAGVAGGLLQMVLGFIVPHSFGVPVVGASAGVFGLVAALATLEPNAVILFNFILPLKAKHYLWIAAGIAVFYIIVPADRGVAHAAHLGGMIAGVAYIRWMMRGGPKLGFGDWFVRLRRRRPIVRVRFPKAPAKRQEPESRGDLPAGDFISREVDPILDKIAAHGIHSLTERERKILEAARRNMEKR